MKLGRPSRPIGEREEKMAAMYAAGITLQNIGDKFGLTRERVRQLLGKIGVDPLSGGKRFVAASNRATATAKQRLRIEQKYGVTPEVLKTLQANGAALRYQYHKRNSKNRAIPFNLTLGQWWSVWAASGKYDLCGKGIGKFCMSRIKDSGAYELGNVHIQSSQENSREAVAKWLGKTKKHRGVYLLYPGRPRAYDARVNKRSIGFFETAEQAAAARAAYMAEHGIAENGAGRGKGWTLLARCKTRPYFMQAPGGAKSYHATADEAHAAYLTACAAHFRQIDELMEA